MDNYHLARLHSLQTAPVVGESYMVPCVLIREFNGHEPFHLPVFGDWHNDKDFGQNDFDHYHIDTRFVTEQELEWFNLSGALNIQYLSGVCAINVTTMRDRGVYEDAKEIPRVCLRELGQSTTFSIHENGVLKNLSKQLMQKNFKLDDKCRVCPHKGTSLQGISPVNGVILCPVHAMRFDAKTLEVKEYSAW